MRLKSVLVMVICQEEMPGMFEELVRVLICLHLSFFPAHEDAYDLCHSLSIGIYISNRSTIYTNLNAKKFIAVSSNHSQKDGAGE
jgi:hypothetical protein